jgi:hypothetical protein
MAERKRRAVERDTRRESLFVLLSRARRGVPLTPAEAALMFAHVEVELAEADELRRTVQGQQTAIQAAYDRTAAAEDAIGEAEQRAETAKQRLAGYEAVFGPDAVEDFHAMQHRAKTAEQRLVRIRGMADAWERRLPAAICTATAADAMRHAADGDDAPVMFKVTNAQADDQAERHAAGHVGNGANAEDCPACRPEIDKTVLYPWICPGPKESATP